MTRLSTSRSILLLGAVLLLLVGVFYLREGEQDVYIPLPFVKPLNQFATLQWEPAKKRLPRGAHEAMSHPGYLLAQAHCVRCHQLPRPEQLPRETWPFVLTWMSNYLGYTNTYGPFGHNVERAQIPVAPLIAESDLQLLSEYYQLFAPTAEVLTPRDGAAREEAVRFEARNPGLPLPNGLLIPVVHFDEKRGEFYIGRGDVKALQVFDRSGRILLNKATQSEPVGVSLVPDGFRVTVMGNFMENERQGQVLDVVVDDQRQLRTTVVAEGYHRLTETHTHDLDEDGVDDLLLIGFGAGMDGEVSIRWGGENEVLPTETRLLDYSGALNAKLHDFDRDGSDDIVILTAQSKQEILLFLNRGERRFERRVIHQGAVGFGFNSLSLCDTNGDGWTDLLVANGNNMEIKDAPLKPYHGLRIFENQRDLTFSESFFYPMYGALKAIAEDFDGDGDQDVVAIAFYPNWDAENPETFVYLENLGENQFRPWGLDSTDSGRWISMDVADVNQDGWKDILLGGGYIQQGIRTDQRSWFVEWSQGRPSVVVLENRGAGEVNLE